MFYEKVKYCNDQTDGSVDSVVTIDSQESVCYQILTQLPTPSPILPNILHD